MGDAVIHTNNLIYDFGSVRAIDGVSLDVPPNCVFGLLGPNGSGKSTLIRLLLGLLIPRAGQSLVLGYDTRTDGKAIRRETGSLLGQETVGHTHSAEEILVAQGRKYEMTVVDRLARTRELLTALDLWDRRREPVSRWSRGMKQQLAIAKALFHRPRLLLLDEPTAGLDPEAAGTLGEKIGALVANEQVSVFLATHKLSDVEQLCSRIAVIRSGRILACGSKLELQSAMGLPVLEITGKGFSDNMIALLSRRHEVGPIHHSRERLVVELIEPDAQTWPLVSLLVESGADIEEVHKKWAGLAYLLNQCSADPRDGNGAGGFPPDSVDRSAPEPNNC